MKQKPNKTLIRSLQPMGGISFKDKRYIKTGTGYIACIRIYQYPENVDDFWLSSILLEHEAITTIDVSTQDRNSSVENLRGIIKELENQHATEKDPIQIQEIISQIGGTVAIAESINSNGEVIKFTTAKNDNMISDIFYLLLFTLLFL